MFRIYQIPDFANYLSNSLPNHDIEHKVDNPAELLSALQNNQEQLLLVIPIYMEYKK